MLINRQNYEEYFLMYADDELSIHQRMEVEWFAQQNPDLAAELGLLQQARLAPDEAIVFTGKDALLKIPEGHVNFNNYETFFLSYIDQELTEDERADVEKFILQHPQLQEEFTLLKQTVSLPEQITFEHKETLYRHKEEKRAPVPMRWWRVAAAAVLLLGIAVVWRQLPRNHSTVEVPGNDLAQTKQPVPEQKHPTVDQGATAATKNSGIDTAASFFANPVKQDGQLKKKVSEQFATTPHNKVEAQKQPLKQEAPQPVKQQEPQVAVNDPIKQETQPSPLIAAIPETKKETHTAPIEQSSKPLVTTTTKSDVHTSATPVTAAVKTTAVNTNNNPLLYKELDTESDDERRTVYVASIQLNKSKVKNFLKKASRIFGGKNEEETNDGKLQVANFEIDKADNK